MNAIIRYLLVSKILKCQANAVARRCWGSPACTPLFQFYFDSTLTVVKYKNELQNLVRNLIPLRIEFRTIQEPTVLR